MIKWVRELIIFVLFIVLQTLVINHIRLFGIVTPYVYLYVILTFRIDRSRSAVILLSFLLGLFIDIFSNTYGIHAAACALIGFIRDPLLAQFVDTKELPDGSAPSFRLLGFIPFARYALILIAIHHIVLYAIDSFGFYQPLSLLVRVLSSILLTSLLLFIIESFNSGRVKHGE